MSVIDPVQLLRRMLEDVHKDPKTHSKEDLQRAAEAVFGALDESIVFKKKGEFVLYLKHEMDTLDVQDVDGSMNEEGVVSSEPIPPLPDPIIPAPKPMPARQPIEGMETVKGKVDGNHTYGGTYKIRLGVPITLPKEAAKFFRARGLVS